MEYPTTVVPVRLNEFRVTKQPAALMLVDYDCTLTVVSAVARSDLGSSIRCMELNA